MNSKLIVTVYAQGVEVERRESFGFHAATSYEAILGKLIERNVVDWNALGNFSKQGFHVLNLISGDVIRIELT